MNIISTESISNLSDYIIATYDAVKIESLHLKNDLHLRYICLFDINTKIIIKCHLPSFEYLGKTFGGSVE